MAEHLRLSAFAPMVHQQEPAAAFGEPIDVDRTSAVRRALHEAFVAQPEKIGVELPATPEGQNASNLAGVMPARITERLKHQALQLAALPHTGILAECVSTFSLVTGTRGIASRMGETA